MPDYSKDSLTELGPATDADLAIHGEEISIIEDLEREVSQEVDGMTADVTAGIMTKKVDTLKQALDAVKK